jgi:hypothetical protein
VNKNTSKKNIDNIKWTKLNCTQNKLDRRIGNMIRVNLFDPWRPPVYGTATTSDILSVSTMALLFCVVMAFLTYGVGSVLMALK